VANEARAGANFEKEKAARQDTEETCARLLRLMEDDLSGFRKDAVELYANQETTLKTVAACIEDLLPKRGDDPTLHASLVSVLARRGVISF
jgi:hypothetical protein